MRVRTIYIYKLNVLTRVINHFEMANIYRQAALLCQLDIHESGIVHDFCRVSFTIESVACRYYIA